MPRIRTIKPEFWTNEDLASVSYEARLMAIALLNHSDDEGWFRAHPLIVKAACFPFDDDSTIVRRTFDELSSIAYLELFKGSDGKSYGRVVNFSEHQRVDRAKPSKIKGLCTDPLTSTNVRRSLDDGSTGESKGREQGSGNGNDSMSGQPDVTAATCREVIEYLNERAGKRFRDTEANLKFVRARIAEGHSVDDLRAVVDRKVAEWCDDPKMAGYLRPATLFNAEKFNQYVGQLGDPLPGDSDATSQRPASRADRHAASLRRSRTRVGA